MAPKAPDASSPAGKAWDEFVNGPTSRIPDFPADSNFNASSLTGKTPEEIFEEISDLVKNNAAYRTDFNEQLATFDFNGKTYEFNDQGNFVDKPVTGTPAAGKGTPVQGVPARVDGVTTKQYNDSVPSLKTELEKISKRLEKIEGPEAVKLKNKIDELLNNNKVSTLTDAELDTLKSIINNADTITKTRLGKVSEMVNNNKVFFAVMCAFLCYEGYNRRANKAKKNREECMAQCKPVAFDAWALGAITTDQLTNPPAGNENTVNCDGSCWNTEGNKSDHFCTSTLTPTPQECETYCTTNCNKKYPLPDPSEIFSSQNLSEGAQELSENGLDIFKNLFNFLPGDLIAKVFIVIAIVFGGLLLFLLIGVLKRSLSQKNV